MKISEWFVETVAKAIIAIEELNKDLQSLDKRVQEKIAKAKKGK